MWKIFATAAATAAAAHGIGFGVGAFGGAAMPKGDMAARDSRVINYGELEGSDAGSSAAFGGKALVGVAPAVSVELAVAYHPNYDIKHWEEDRWLDEPTLTLVPITVGGRYSFALGAGGVYVGAGGGYFLETLGLFGGGWGPVTIVSHGGVDINAPGAYVAGGLTYRLWKFELEAGPRFTTVWNKGDYDYTYEAKVISPPTYETEVRRAELKKDFNDSFVDILAGVNYYFM